MGTTITDTLMRSTETAHTATAWPVPGEPTLWTVTWLPGRNLTRNQAITAMTIAAYVGRGVGLSDDPVWPHIEGWAAELGLSGARAVVLASEPPASEMEAGR
jgi:hypothetical protein